MSPFTLVFKQYDTALAAMFMNGIVLLAILSTANSGLYVASRLFWHMAKEGQVPRLFTKVNKRGVPMQALLVTSSISFLAFLSSLFGNGIVYLWLLNAGSLAGLIAWMGIAISHYRFRKAYISQGKDLHQLPYLAKGYPYGPLFAFGLCLVIIGGQNYAAFMNNHIDWYGLIISYIGLPLFLLLWLGNKWLKKTRIINLQECKFDFETH